LVLLVAKIHPAEVINRLNDLADVVHTEGRVLIDGENILDPEIDVIALRRKIGMVFARPVVYHFRSERT
jgi:phosphate transport system ATP-binding protein